MLGVDISGAPDRVYAPLPVKPLVSVVVTSFNSEETVERSLSSILSQDYRNLELLVVDDGSQDDTCALVRRIQSIDPRVRLLAFGGNHGTYWAKNHGIVMSRGDVVTFQDSDDESEPQRISMQLEMLRGTGAVVSTCQYRRLDEKGRNLPVPNSRGFAFITQMMRRELFETIGFFDSVRTSADDEMFHRIKLVFGPKAHVNVRERLYNAYVRDGSLSHNEDNPKYSQETGGLSPARKLYAQGFHAWHLHTLRSGAVPYMPFPVINRPFPVDPRMMVDRNAESNEGVTVVVHGASKVENEPFTDAIRSVLACATGAEGSAKRIDVRYLEAPTFASALDAVRSSQGWQGYLFFLGARFSALPQHVQETIRAVERHRREAVIVLSGLPDASAHSPFGELGAFGLHSDLLARISDGESEAFLTGRMEPLQSSESAGLESAAETSGDYREPTRQAEVSGHDCAVGDAAQPAARVDSETDFVRAPAGAEPSRFASMRHDVLALARSFGALWTRSEVLAAGAIAGCSLLAVVGIAFGWAAMSELAELGIVVSIAILLVFTARRIRVGADPSSKAKSYAAIGELKAAVRRAHHTHIARSRVIGVIEGAQGAATGEPVAEPRLVESDSLRDGARALERLLSEVEATPEDPACLSMLRLLERRYVLGADTRAGLEALASLLLSACRRNDLAAIALKRFEARSGGSSAALVRLAREGIENEALLRISLSQVIESIRKSAGGHNGKHA